MLSHFFIRRPIFAAVIAIIITIAGLVASQVLPVAQYPEIAPPTVAITASFPGASAETLAKTVAAPIEEQLSGVENLIYFDSTASSNGTLTITATFEVGTDINNATIQVNNRVQIALPRLPDDVRRAGVVVQKRTRDILMVVAASSSDARYDTLFLSNFLTVNVLDVLKRVPGVADASIFGARDYSMRVWLRPDRMAQLGVTTTDVANAIRAQNNQYAAGKIGQEPATADQPLVYSVTARGRLLDPGEFGNIILRGEPTRPACCASRTWPASNSAPRPMTSSPPWRQADHRHRDLPAVGRQRAQGRRICARRDDRVVENVSTGCELSVSVRHDACGRRVDPGGHHTRCSRRQRWC